MDHFSRELSEQVGDLREFSESLLNRAHKAYGIGIGGSLGAPLVQPTVRDSASAAAAVTEPWLLKAILDTAGERAPGLPVRSWAESPQAFRMLHEGALGVSCLLRIDRFAKEHHLPGVPRARTYTFADDPVIDVFNPIVQVELARRSRLELPHGGVFDTDAELAKWLNDVRNRTDYLQFGDEALVVEALRWEVMGSLSWVFGGAPPSGIAGQPTPPGFVEVTVKTVSDPKPPLRILFTKKQFQSWVPFGGYSPSARATLQTYQYYYFAGEDQAGNTFYDAYPYHCTPYNTLATTNI